MSLVDQITQREGEAAQRAAANRQETQREYTCLLARNELPAKGDAARLAEVMAALGRTSSDLKVDLERISHLRQQRRFAAELGRREREAADALAAVKPAQALLESETKRLTAVVAAAKELQRDTEMRAMRSRDAAMNLTQREQEFNASGLHAGAVDAPAEKASVTQ